MTRVLAWSQESIDCPGLLAALERSGIEVVHLDLAREDPARRERLDALDPIEAGLTGAFAGLADTGSLVLAHEPGRSRMASLLPPVHVAILRHAREVHRSIPTPIRPDELSDLATARGRKDTIFTVSGYGLSYRVQPHSALSNISFRVRLMAESTLVNLRSELTDGYNLQTQGNGDQRGGTCSGDSCGPVFLGGPDSNVIVAVTSFGLNSLCRGTDFSYRIDRTEVLDWINSH